VPRCGFSYKIKVCHSRAGGNPEK